MITDMEYGDFLKVKAGDFVVHGFGRPSLVTDVYEGGMLCFDPGLDDGSGLCEVNFCWNECETCTDSQREEFGMSLLMKYEVYCRYKEQRLRMRGPKYTQPKPKRKRRK